MSDERKEAVDIARAVRRYVERERAGGGGELLADSVAKARREGRETGGRDASAKGNGEGLPDGPGPGDRGGLRDAPAKGDRGGLCGESKPAGSQGLAEAGFVSARAARMSAPSGRKDHPGRAAPAPAIVTNLFGEPEPEPIPKQRQSQSRSAVLDDPALEMFEEGLNPGGLDARAAVAAEALPLLEQIAGEACACTQCGLCETRTQAVPGVGTARSGIVFVGEAPGADEDRLGEPFVGRAGQLLDKIVKAMDDARLIPGLPLDRSSVYICNVLKCRPPENRNPLPHEVESCSPYLRRQLEAMRPRIICCLGKFAAELLVGIKGTIGASRGKVYRYQGAKLIVTYHPAACLRNPAYKRPVWEDMQLLAREYLSD